MFEKKGIERVTPYKMLHLLVLCKQKILYVSIAILGDNSLDDCQETCQYLEQVVFGVISFGKISLIH